MNSENKAQLQLEAAICFAVFLAVLGLFLAAINQAGEKANNSLNAKAEAELCCIAANAIYASGVSELLAEMHCTSKANAVKSKIGGKIKGCESIAKEIRLVQKGKTSVLEVTINEHYK